MQTALLLLPDFALIFLGMCLRPLLHLGDHVWSGIEKLTFYVLFPALLFNALTRSPIDVAGMAPVLAIGLLATTVGGVLALAARPLYHGRQLTFVSQFQCAFRFNTYPGLAVASKLYGIAGVTAMGILCGVMVPIVNVVAVWALARHGEASALRELLRNPIILATLGGLAWNFGGLGVAEPLRHVLGRLSEASITLGLLTVGAALRPRFGLPPLAVRAANAWMVAVKLLMVPAVAWLLIRASGLGGLGADIALAFAALPTASNAYILTQRMGGDGPAVAWLVSATTVGAMLSMPMWFAITQ